MSLKIKIYIYILWRISKITKKMFEINHGGYGESMV